MNTFDPNSTDSIAHNLKLAGYALRLDFDGGWKATLEKQGEGKVYMGDPCSSPLVAIQRAARYFLAEEQAEQVRAVLEPKPSPARPWSPAPQPRPDATSASGRGLGRWKGPPP